MDRILTIQCKDHKAACAAKDKLRAKGLHAFLSPDREFSRWPGSDEWNAAHTILCVLDQHAEVGDIRPVIERILDIKLEERK